MRDCFVIDGGVPLRGEIFPSGNKNAALPALAAVLLTDEPVTLRNLPAIRDVETMAELLAALGVDVERLDAKTWRLQAQEEEDFDPDEIEPVLLSRRITGFNCRMAEEEPEDADEDIEWLDEWENSNSLPKIVELTLFMPPLERNGDPTEIKRIVGIPVTGVSWR